jgi:RND family efflux transporter MFP subunit
MFNRRHAMFAAVLIAAIACTGTAYSQSSPVQTFTRPAKDLQLGFTPNGQVSEVLVKEGDKVKKGDVLIRLRADDIRVAREINRLHAETDLEIRAAEAQWAQAKVELEINRDLQNKGVGSPQEFRRAEAQELIAGLRVESAKKDNVIARKELERSDVILSYYELRAPIDGIVQRVIVSEGETVEQLKPVLRLVSIDPMEVHAPVRTGDTQSLKVGDPAWVVHQLHGHAEPLEGKIKLIDPVADSGSDTRRVVIELPNPKQLPPGVQVSVTFEKPAPLADAK